MKVKCCMICVLLSVCIQAIPFNRCNHYRLLIAFLIKSMHKMTVCVYAILYCLVLPKTNSSSLMCLCILKNPLIIVLNKQMHSPYGFVEMFHCKHPIQLVCVLEIIMIKHSKKNSMLI